MNEDDFLEKEDNWLMKDDGLPTPNPPDDEKDGQDDHIDKETCSSYLATLEEEHEDRRMLSIPDHLNGDFPPYSGVTVVTVLLLLQGYRGPKNQWEQQ